MNIEGKITNDVVFLTMLLNRYPISIISMDVAALSTQKLIITDSDDKIIDGNPDPSFPEFHLFRIESVVKPQNFLAKVVYGNSGYK